MAGSSIVGLLTQREYKGGIDLSYGLRFEPSDNSVRMTDVKLAKLNVDGTPDLMERPLSRFGAHWRKNSRLGDRLWPTG